MQPPTGGDYILFDVHGAGAQRSDPKSGDPADYPYGHGPQGDVIRIFNYVRAVRLQSAAVEYDDTYENTSNMELPVLFSVSIFALICLSIKINYSKKFEKY